ncbi:Uncharacterised protein [Vibrio cholerae]|nr:Uncharacterised protein [Vibrio cholerae]CSD44701.1 Uncharacterised protein [Vibrio cholerae]CSI84411.1 Uncharacterised protein [Vibrio cholerae]
MMSDKPPCSRAMRRARERTSVGVRPELSSMYMFFFSMRIPMVEEIRAQSSSSS